MLLKSADDKSDRIKLLETLSQSDRFDDWSKKKLAQELANLREGLIGEKEAAFHINALFGDSKNVIVIHDLRLEHEGGTVQIDHLAISRFFYVYVIESKNYGANVDINERGEFSVRYGRNPPFGIESPIEQNRRHVEALRKLFVQHGITSRVSAPTFRSVVMFHPKAVIKRPRQERFDTSMVIKADQFRTLHEKTADAASTLEVFKSIANVVSHEMLLEWGNRLVSLHKPAPLAQMPAYVKLKPVVGAPASAPAPKQAPASTGIQETKERRLICATCGKKISYAEGKFCWNNEKRFGGLQYCREHQSAF
jgi:hypothetical protein